MQSNNNDGVQPIQNDRMARLNEKKSNTERDNAFLSVRNSSQRAFMSCPNQRNAECTFGAPRFTGTAYKVGCDQVILGGKRLVSDKQE
eukprot:6214593-Pleurochrysis_carterae.AAC.5